eukprot:255737_1
MAQETTDGFPGFITLLKVNNKGGWRQKLFVDENKMSAFLCAYCNHVCCNAVEAGCKHKSTDVDAYCSHCLSALVKQNGGNCPIDGHPNPQIHPIASIRSKILKADVLCPCSAAYKLRSATYVGYTPGGDEDEKEGGISSGKGCSWSGPLTVLINQHLIECVAQNNPPYIQKLKINELNMRLEEQKDVIFDLEQQMATLKSALMMKQSEFRVEHTSDEWIKCGKFMQMQKERILTKKGIADGFNTAYSVHAVTADQHEWKIRIVKKPRFVTIGIASTMDHCDTFFDGTADAQDPFHAAYRSDGVKVSNNTAWTPYGGKFGDGDIITVKLNLNNKGLITFDKNGVYQGVAFNTVDGRQYRLAVCMHGEDGCVELVSYKNNL